MNTLIPEQSYIRISKPSLSGSLDYKREVAIFEKIDHILSKEGFEDKAKMLYLDYLSKEQDIYFDQLEQLRIQRRASQCIRVNIAKSLLGCSFRELSVRISDSNLLQWFCRFDCPLTKKLPSKSKLNDLSRLMPEGIIREFINILLITLKDGVGCIQNNIDLDAIYVDSTCLKLNIHHPVDWVLIRDAIKSIMKTIQTTRNHGLKHRIKPTENFMKSINRLSIDMTMTRAHRKEDAKRKRKDTLREMKSLMKTVESHGYRYLLLLNKSWNKSSLSKKQAENLSMNLIKVLDKVDDIIFQAHERIIGERKVQNKKKILSLYEQHAQVYTRRKAGAEVEFGLQFFLAETKQGLVVDWDLLKDKVQNDSKFVKPCIERLQNIGITPKEFTGDRGFVSPRADNILQKNKIKNYIFPRNIKKLKHKQRQIKFIESTNRRSQTEARIGIIKNSFLNGKLNTKGFENQSQQVAWAILSHNLWVLARMPIEIENKISA